jgi:hypothetical protein
MTETLDEGFFDCFGELWTEALRVDRRYSVKGEFEEICPEREDFNC